MKHSFKIYPIELISFVWIFITGLFIIVFPYSVIHTTEAHLLRERVFILVGFSTLIYLHKRTRWDFIRYFRQLIPIVLIIYWYPETYYYNQAFFKNIDPFLISADQWLCGFQPSTMFSYWISAPWFSELMNFSYVSFYFVLIFIHFYFLIVNQKKAFFTAFVLLNSFLLFYAFYIILPAEGPQFFVCHNPAMALPMTGPMRRLVLFFHSLGEVPNGAFPSSHVGLMMTYMILLWFHGRKVFVWLLPFSLLLAMSTVYIKAHYLVDVIAGAAFAFPFYFYSVWLWNKLTDWLHPVRK